MREVTHRCAAVGFLGGQAEHAEFAELRPQRVRKCVVAIGLRRQRRNLAAREFLHGLTQLVDVFAKREVETDAVHICTRSDASGTIAATGMREPTGPRPRSEESRVGKEGGSK